MTTPERGCRMETMSYSADVEVWLELPTQAVPIGKTGSKELVTAHKAALLGELVMVIDGEETRRNIVIILPGSLEYEGVP